MSDPFTADTEKTRAMDDPKKDLEHYYKFERIQLAEVSIGEVFPAVMNPKTVDLSDLFNAAFCYLLDSIDKDYGLDDDDMDKNFKLEMQGSMPLMAGILKPLARLLMQQPLSEGSNQNAGPTFEFYDFGSEGSSRKALYDSAGSSFEIDDVAAADVALIDIDNL